MAGLCGQPQPLPAGFQVVDRQKDGDHEGSDEQKQEPLAAEQGPEAAACESKSGGIVDTLDGLLDMDTAVQPGVEEVTSEAQVAHVESWPRPSWTCLGDDDGTSGRDSEIGSEESEFVFAIDAANGHPTSGHD